MPLSERTKKIIMWTIGFLVVVGVIVGLIFLFRSISSSSPPTQVTVSVTLVGPGNITKKGTVYYDRNRLLSQTIGDFVGSVITTSKLLQQKSTNVVWNNMALNSKLIQLDKGQPTEESLKQKLTDFLGAIPTQISFTAIYIASCLETEKPLCDPCLGQTAKCTSTGWICVDHQVCPTGEDLYNCCVNNSNGPFPTCSQGIITCGQCPVDKKLNCGEPGCGAVGNMCTATGWICAPGKTCPTDMSKCCATGLFAVCKQDGTSVKIVCSECKDPNPPKCDADCNMSDLVCGQDGKYQCVKGTTCPPDAVRKACCKSTEFAVCDTPGPDAKVQCKSCPDPKPTGDPNYQKCQYGSCEGHGWVCTSDGWVCKPNQTRPPNGFDYSQCCPASDGPNVPYWDDNTKCIKCSCPQGTTGCSNMPCGKPTGSCASTCCPIGQPCHRDAGSGQCLCCPEQQICVLKSGDTKCCPDNTICKENECLPICGKDSAGSAITCTAGQICLEVDNLSDDNIGKLKKEYGDDAKINGRSAFVCVTNKGCNFHGNEVAVPYATANYYPCYPFPDFHDPDEPGPGYCTERDGNPLGTCATKHTKSKECNQDASCVWRNILKYMSSKDDPKNPAGQIEKEMQVIQNSQLGYFCDPSKGTTPYSRVVAYMTDKDTCNWDDCWARMAQPGVIDVEYNSDNGVCVALQSCNNPSAGLNSGMIDSSGNKVLNPTLQSLPWNLSGYNSSFPDCDQKDTICPIPSTQSESYVCAGSCTSCETPNQFVRKGQVSEKRYGCNPDNNYKCEIKGANGGYTNLTLCQQDNNNPCCPAGTKHYNDGCYMYNPPKVNRGQLVQKMQGWDWSGPIVCSGDPNNSYSDFTPCGSTTATDHQSCWENNKNPTPKGAYYCQGVPGGDDKCNGRSFNGKWVLCTQDNGCNLLKNSWYWDTDVMKTDPPVSYCTWPPTVF